MLGEISKKKHELTKYIATTVWQCSIISLITEFYFSKKEKGSHSQKICLVMKHTNLYIRKCKIGPIVVQLGFVN